MTTYLNDGDKVSELLKNPEKIKDVKLTENGARVRTERGTYFIGIDGINGVRNYTPNERTVGSLTGLDVFGPVKSGYTMKPESSYKQNKSN